MELLLIITLFVAVASLLVVAALSGPAPAPEAVRVRAEDRLER